MTNNTMISSVRNVQFVPSMDSVSFRQAKATVLDLRSEIKAAKEERLNAMEQYLYDNAGELFSERELAAAFDLDFRDVVQYRTSIAMYYDTDIFCASRRDLEEYLKPVMMNKNYCTAFTPYCVTLKIFGYMAYVKWQAMDDDGNPIPGRVNFRKEPRYFWTIERK